MARIKKVQRDKAIAALKKAGAPSAVAASMWRLLDLEENLDPQIAELVEEDPELFASTATDEDDDAPELTPGEALRARLSGGHRLRPARPEGSPAQQNAQALGAGRARPERPTTAPATAQAAAARLRTGIGRAADS
ncbi:hypothetical protein [Streptomyces mutabilis]|uniref:hypothetical protein n=1 Tax=Streptomyces mutabilis TaxID=67332 RepID=UPI003420D5A4